MKKIHLIIGILVLCAGLLLIGCTNGHSSTDGHEHGAAEAEHHEEEGHDHEEGIHLTREQMKTMKIGFGHFSEMKINDYVSATGTLGLPPNAYSSVSAKANGFIRGSNKYVEGNFVNKGERLAYLENPEFIQRQQEYLEIAADMTYLEQELARQQTLLDQQAGVEKTVQKLQSEVNRKTATLKGLAKQLAYWGIGADQLTPDNIVERIVIVSPMSGFITTINMHNGMYVTSQEELMEIVSEDHLHLELDIFEKDIAKVKEEQRISYTVPALGNEVYEGEVHVIGKEFNTENKTVRIHGHLEKERPRFVKDLFVEAKIWLNDQTVRALPEKAIIKDGASSYIYVTREIDGEGEAVAFEQVMVIPGTSDGGFTAVELVNPLPEGSEIVTEGAYYVYAQSKAGALKHEH